MLNQSGKIDIFDAFTGFGGFTLAAEKAFGNKLGKVYFSEVDKYANSVLKYHWPHIKNYGDITKIDIEALPDFDLLTAGFPCQDLSIAKKNREGLEGSRSGLFYKLVEILKIKKPRYFIFENVFSMGKENRDKISEILGVEGVMINASLVSAQNRKRIFWANFPITQTKDRGILLKDILEKDVDESFYVKDLEKLKYLKGAKKVKRIKSGGNSISRTTNFVEKLKSNTVRSSGRGSGIDNKHNWDTIRIGSIGKGGQGDRIYSPDGKSVNLSVNGGGRGAKTGLYLIKGAASRGRNLVGGKRKDVVGAKTQQRIEIGGDKANTITSVFKDSMVLENSIVRKLTPIECCRLMTMPDDWLDYGIDEKGNQIEISNSQRYKLAGNGVVVEVVDGIIKDFYK